MLGLIAAVYWAPLVEARRLTIKVMPARRRGYARRS
jgi:hypothetical protein